jgi:hypothetical protein
MLDKLLQLNPIDAAIAIGYGAARMSRLPLSLWLAEINTKLTLRSKMTMPIKFLHESISEALILFSVMRYAG